jgi:hypothetical protein
MDIDNWSKQRLIELKTALFTAPWNGGRVEEVTTMSVSAIHYF